MTETNAVTENANTPELEQELLVRLKTAILQQLDELFSERPGPTVKDLMVLRDLLQWPIRTQGTS